MSAPRPILIILRNGDVYAAPAPEYLGLKFEITQITVDASGRSRRWTTTFIVIGSKPRVLAIEPAWRGRRHFGPNVPATWRRLL